LTCQNRDYYPDIEDFLITEINNVTNEPNFTFWSLWLNFKYVKVGGCQAQIKDHDSVLWALIPQKFDAQMGTRDVSSTSDQLIQV
jgi:hypothetical protein